MRRAAILIDKDPRYSNCFGFIKELGIEEFDGTFIQTVSDWQNAGFEVGCGQVDVEAAFTSIPHKRLILVMYDFVERSKDEEKSYYLVAYTHMWLKNRVVYFQKTSVKMCSGVPQGAAYSPTVFLIYLDYVGNDLVNCKILYYADDVTFLIRSKTMIGLRTTSENVLDHFSNWLQTKELRCENSKSKFMIFNKTAATVDKYFENFKIPIKNSIKILGIDMDSKLNFSEHTERICNSIRLRSNLLRMLKKHGLSIEHSLQFILCIRSVLFFGLWWQTKISENNWQKIERSWNNMVRTALHESCPKCLPVSELRRLSGVPGIREFSEYLMHARMNKISDPDFQKCERFTLNLKEYQSIKSVFKPASSKNLRQSTKRQSSKIRTQTQKQQLLKSYGPIRTYLFMLAEQHKWKNKDFLLSKDELQAKYKIKSKGVHNDLAQLQKHEIIEKLVSLCSHLKFKEILI